MKVIYEETERHQLPEQPEFVILMVKQRPMFPPLTLLDKGQKTVYLTRFKERILGIRYVDGEYTNDWVQYK